MQRLEEVKRLLSQALELLSDDTLDDQRVHVWTAAAYHQTVSAIAVIVCRPEIGDLIITRLVRADSLEEAETDALYLGLSQLFSQPFCRLERPLVVHVTSSALLAFLDSLEIKDAAGERTLPPRLQQKQDELATMVLFLKNLVELDIRFHLEPDRVNLVRCQAAASELLQEALGQRRSSDA